MDGIGRYHRHRWRVRRRGGGYVRGSCPSRGSRRKLDRCCRSFTRNTGSSSDSGTLAAIEVTPRALNIPPRGTQQFSAIGRLSNGNTATVRVNWTASGGSITTGGLYTAGTAAGTFRIIAVRQGDTQADTSSVTVTATPPTLVGVLVSPVSISVAPGTAQQFSAVGRNSDGTHSSIAVTWRATGGTITTGGLYMAGTTAGTFRVIAVRQGDTKADTASVTITAPAPTLTAVEVTPASASLAAGRPGSSRRWGG